MTAKLKPRELTIRNGWDEYQQKILHPAGAGDIQVQETKRAFMAGGYAMFSILMRIAEPDISENRGEDVLSKISHEFQRFYEDVDAGLA